MRFTAHRLELGEAQLAGFHDLRTKPFDIETMAQQVRTQLNAAARSRPAPAGAPPPQNPSAC